jgi:hypothetical protein
MELLALIAMVFGMPLLIVALFIWPEAVIAIAAIGTVWSGWLCWKDWTNRADRPSGGRRG